MRKIFFILTAILLMSLNSYENSTDPGDRVGAVCKDGTTSTATGSGACSHHGGVDHWINKLN